MKILIIVLSHNDNGGVYSKFYEAQKNTWDSLNVDGINTYYLFGNHDKNEIIDVIFKKNKYSRLSCY